MNKKVSAELPPEPRGATQKTDGNTRKPSIPVVFPWIFLEFLQVGFPWSLLFLEFIGFALWFRRFCVGWGSGRVVVFLTLNFPSKNGAS